MRGQSLYCVSWKNCNSCAVKTQPSNHVPLHSIMLYFDPFGDNMKRSRNYLKWVSPSERDLSVTDNFLQETICEVLPVISIILPYIGFTPLMKAFH